MHALHGLITLKLAPLDDFAFPLDETVLRRGLAMALRRRVGICPDAHFSS